MSDLRDFENAADAADSILTKGVENQIEDGFGNALSPVKVNELEADNIIMPSGNSYMASYTARGGSNATIELPFSDANNRINGIVIATTTSLFGNNNYRMTLFHVWGRMNNMGFVEINSEINGGFTITNAMSNPSAGVIRLDGEYEFTSRVSLSFNGTVLGE